MISSWLVYGCMMSVVAFLLASISAMFNFESSSSNTPEVYECGIEPMVESKIPFGMHFFNVGVLFLLFDIELVVCIPLVGMMVTPTMWKGIIVVVLEILFIGLAVETVDGSLDWKE